jgi:DNA-binding response OmpR family regulator
MHILFVEDDEALRYAIARQMRAHGHTVYEACDAAQALSQLLVQSVDVIVTDVEMPGTTGEVFAAEARAIRSTVRLVFATGHLHLRDPGLGAGGPRVVHKPYTWETLAAVLS